MTKFLIFIVTQKLWDDFFLSEEKIIKKLEGGVNVTVG